MTKHFTRSVMAAVLALAWAGGDASDTVRTEHWCYIRYADGSEL
jgi:hypothetical protein